jgi:antitoxin component of MazEF toxin-antitoxin module
MPARKTVKKVGGSLAIFIPRDVAELMGVVAGSSVRLTLVGKRLSVEPENKNPKEAK